MNGGEEETVLGTLSHAIKDVLRGMHRPQQRIVGMATQTTVQRAWLVMVLKAMDMVKTDDAHVRHKFAKEPKDSKSLDYFGQGAFSASILPQSTMLTIFGYLRQL
jgi:hypothetical protein